MKFFPIIGEVFTAAESVVCLGASGVAALCGDDKAANELLGAAGNAWVDYAENNMIATPINGIICDIKGDHCKSEKLREKYGENWSNLADGTPVVGHIKGVVHYAKGDKEKGHKAMESATRTTAVLGAGVLTGGVGAGIAIGAAAGIGTGLAYDTTATLIDHEVNGNKARLHGNLGVGELFDKEKLKKMNVNEFTQRLLGAPVGVVSDGLTGAAGAKLGQNIRGHLTKSPAQKNLVSEYKKAGVENSPDAAKLTMEAAKEAKKVNAKLGKNVNGTTSKVMDTSNGKSGVGNSGKIRNEVRAQNFEQNGFPSKNAARNANDYGTRSHLQSKYSKVEPVPGRSVPQNACAEHQAFNNYNKVNPNYSTSNTQTATVYNKGGNYTSIERCGNCKAYGDGMGNVLTDKIPTGTPVPAETYVSAGNTTAAVGAATAAAVIRGTVKESRQRS